MFILSFQDGISNHVSIILSHKSPRNIPTESPPRGCYSRLPARTPGVRCLRAASGGLGGHGGPYIHHPCDRFRWRFSMIFAPIHSSRALTHGVSFGTFFFWDILIGTYLGNIWDIFGKYVQNVTVYWVIYGTFIETYWEIYDPIVHLPGNIYGGFHKWGNPHSWMVYNGK